MILNETKIPGAYVVEPNIFEDTRGRFVKTFHENTFRKYNLSCDFKESFYSTSQKGIIRGMHFQLPPHDHAKLVYVTKGVVIDVVLDVRKGSPAYGEYTNIELSEENGNIVYIPKGCAHGFVSLADGTCVTYLQTTCHVPHADAGIHYDSFGMDWNIDNPILSERDKAFAPFNDFDTPFVFVTNS